MRKQKSGHIINISSIGGFIGLGGAGIYGATKFSVDGITESLAQEDSSYSNYIEFNIHLF
jgi:short-subunit dehydrogenase